MRLKGLGLFMRRSEEHTSELQSRSDLVCRLLHEKKIISSPAPSHAQKDHERNHKRRRKANSYPFPVLSAGSAYSLTAVDCRYRFFFFFFNDTATTEIYTLSLHDALPI